jgi:hypothetical protein
MVGKGMYLQEEHPRSGRIALFEVNHYSGWLFLSKPDAPVSRKKALVFSTGHIAPLEEAIKVANAGGKAPLAHEYASDEAIIDDAHPDEFFFWWAEDGESVALLRLGAPLAMIIAANERGHTKAVHTTGFYGDPWHQDHYEKLFGREIF